MNLQAYGFVPAGNWQLCSTVKSGIRFKLSQHQYDRVVYAFVVADCPKYIGICDNDMTTLKARMNRYQSRCGGSTNRSNASRIYQCLLAGLEVQIYALNPKATCNYGELKVDFVKGLENPLIAKFKPEWNGKTEAIEAECDG